MKPISYFRKSINVQFLTLSALSILFTGGLIGFMSYQLAKKVIEEKLIRNDLPVLVKLKANKIESELDKALKVSQIFSSDPDLIQWFQSKESNKQLGLITKTKMSRIVEILDYTRIFASNLSTTNYYFYEKKLTNSENIGIEKRIIRTDELEDNWFFRFWKSGNDFEINIDKVDEMNTYAYINTLIKEDQKKIGIAGVGVRLNEFVKEFFSIDEFGGITWLVDRKSMKIKISTNFKDIGNTAKNIIGDTVEQQLKVLKSDTLIYLSNNPIGDVTFNAIQPLALNNTVIIYSVPYENIMKPLTIIRTVTIISTTITVSIAFFIFLFYSRIITNPIINLTNIAERISSGELNIRYTQISENEIGRLASSFNTMTDNLAEKNRTLHEYSQNLQEKVNEQTSVLANQKEELEIKNKSMQKELEMGQKVQGIFLVPFYSRSDWYEVYGISIPSKELGGDFFRIYENIKNELWMIIGDVAGKGVASSLIMTASVSLLDQMKGTISTLDNLVKDFNAQIFHLISSNKNSSPSYFITAGCAQLKKENSKYFIYTVNAGHEPPMLFHENEFSFLPSGGKAIGIWADTDYKLNKTELFQGDILIYVTDGIFEQRNESGEFFEFENIQKSIHKHKSESIKNICTHLLEELDLFSTNVIQEDDRTIIVFKIL